MNKEAWLSLVLQATERFKTPFFLFSYLPVIEQLESMSQECGDYRAFNWLSMKTLSLRHLLKWWLRTGLGVEVTSEYELFAACEEGFQPERIMVNGVAKHTWDKKCWTKGLRVNFDSIREIELLAHEAKKSKWRVGLRFHPTVQKDPENPNLPDQFGITTDDFGHAFNLLQENNIILDTVHIHLRSNIPNIGYYRAALEELKLLMERFNIDLNCLDLGGGLPAKGVKQLDPAWESNYSLTNLCELLRLCHERYCLQEIILENGRYILSGCGVLVYRFINTSTISFLKAQTCAIDAPRVFR